MEGQRTPAMRGGGSTDLTGRRLQEEESRAVSGHGLTSASMEVDKAPSEEDASKVTSQSWETQGFPQLGAWQDKQRAGQALDMPQKSGLWEWADLHFGLWVQCGLPPALREKLKTSMSVLGRAWIEDMMKMSQAPLRAWARPSAPCPQDTRWLTLQPRGSAARHAWRRAIMLASRFFFLQVKPCHFFLLGLLFSVSHVSLFLDLVFQFWWSISYSNFLRKGMWQLKLFRSLISENDYSILILAVYFGYLYNSRLVIVLLQNFSTVLLPSWCLCCCQEVQR